MKLEWNNYCITHYFTNETIYQKHSKHIFFVQKHSREKLILFMMSNFMHIQPEVHEIKLNLSN
jgi:hypothetical protein